MLENGFIKIRQKVNKRMHLKTINFFRLPLVLKAKNGVRIEQNYPWLTFLVNFYLFCVINWVHMRQRKMSKKCDELPPELENIMTPNLRPVE